MSSLSLALSLRKMTLPSPATINCHCLSGGVGPHGLSLVHDEMLTSSVLFKSCASHHSCHDFMITAAMSWPEDVYILSASLPQCSQSLGKGVMAVPFKAKQYSDAHAQYLTICINHTSYNKKRLWPRISMALIYGFKHDYSEDKLTTGSFFSYRNLFIYLFIDRISCNGGWSQTHFLVKDDFAFLTPASVS